ncbi:radical SAM protein [Desulfopila sp. IMCC35006]|uniref:radical SAM protein n=1 Tax=Desulfopila sp. IMCC35006 TaxID=2569542 RepID=UPI0010AC8651|nr:radical SAM protein [Desulfopila sp. IMCC35006]TKB24132.1 radical SAM protein [Desulfopila sp. IMCC35006]
MEHPSDFPALLFADGEDNIREFTELDMVGMSNGHFIRPALEDLIPLPEGSDIFTLPGRFPVGWDPRSEEPALLAENPFAEGTPAQAVAAFMAPAHTAILSSSYQTQDGAPTLPLFAYTAVGWHEGRFWVTGFRSDPDKRQDADQYRQADVKRHTKKKLRLHRDNRLIQHLGKCCLTYGCPAARNYFLDRWEAPLPTSPDCNARCLGCISLQASGCCPSTQDRITFVPSAGEISQIAIPHLQFAENPIVSFGQGCEGEPLLQAVVIEEAIRRIRSKTSRGTINLNSNSSLPAAVKRLAQAGLDSLRVSLNSTQEIYYNRYYRPKNYRFSDVTQSIDIMKDSGRFVSLNYFILPGFTDSVQEYDALCSLIRHHHPDFIQLRNLNMDPEWYIKSLALPENTEALGIRQWLDSLQKEFPTLRFGYFNPQVHAETHTP